MSQRYPRSHTLVYLDASSETTASVSQCTRSHVPHERVDSDSDSSSEQASTRRTSGRLIRNCIASLSDSSSEEWVESPAAPKHSSTSYKSNISRSVISTSPSSFVARLATNKEFVNAKVVKGDKIGRVLNFIT